MFAPGSGLKADHLDPAPPLSHDILLKGTAITAAGESATKPGANASVAFRILGELGQGGMGIVYRAEQLYPRRVVALKILKRSLTDDQARKRFEREIEITGKLTHSGIAQFLFPGYMEDGQPFMAMEYVNGMPLTTYVQAHRLSRTSKLTLFAKVCDIIAYSHRQGVIHRDLKPSNILITHEGEPKVLDFGLATIPLDTESNQLTVQGQMVGTLDYMSPEQAEGRLQEVNSGSDVYALGVLLYELLATRRPFDFSSISIVDAVKVITESSPPRLSGVNRSFRGDLDTIVHKALCKDIAGRYSSVEELAQDVRHWLAHEPIKARPPSALYRLKRFVRRHRVLVSSTMLIFLALSLGLAFAAREAIRANRLATSLAKQEAESEISLSKSELLYADKLASEADGQEARKHYEVAWKLLEKNHLSTTEVSLRVWQLDRTFARTIGTLEPKADNISQLAISSDQQHIALGFADGTVEIRNPWRNMREWTFKTTPITYMSYSPNGKYLITLANNALEVRSLSTQQSVFLTRVSRLSRARIAIDNEKLVYVTDDDRGHLHYFETQNIDKEFDLQDANLLAMGLEGDNVLVIDASRNVSRYALDSGQMIRSGVLPGLGVNPVRISPNCKYAVVGLDSQVSTFDLESMREIGHCSESDGRKPLEFVDDSTILSGSKNGNGLLVFDFSGHITKQIPESFVMTLALSKDIAAIKDKSGLVLWSLAPMPGLKLLTNGPTSSTAGALSSDGCIAALPQNDGGVLLIDTVGGRPLGLRNGVGSVKSMVFNGSTTSLAILTTDNVVEVWDFDHPEISFRVPRNVIQGFGYSGDGKVVAFGVPTAHEFETFRQVNGQWNNQKAHVEGTIARIDISSDTSHAALIFMDNRYEVWNTAQGTPMRRILDASPTPWDTPMIMDNSKKEIKLIKSQNGNVVKSFSLPSSPSSVCISRTSKVVALARGIVYFLDPNSDSTEPQLSSPLVSASEVHLNDDGSKVLLTGNHGAVVFDLNIVRVLHDLEPEQSYSPEWWDHGARNWLIYLGLSSPAFDAFNPPLATEGIQPIEAYGLWSAGKPIDAMQIFRTTTAMSPGAKQLILTKLEN